MTTVILTVRHGSAVERDTHETLEAAIAALRARVTRLQADPDLPEVSMLRTFEPSERVKARIELSTGRVFRRREAGLDVMGDGSVVAFTGGTFRRPLETDAPAGSDRDAIYDAIAESLRG